MDGSGSGGAKVASARDDVEKSLLLASLQVSCGGWWYSNNPSTLPHSKVSCGSMSVYGPAQRLVRQ